jgi:hypothetical protein
MAPAGIYPCKPGSANDLSISSPSHANPYHWLRLLKVLEQEDLLENSRFATREARGRHEAKIDQMITDRTRRHDKHEAMRVVALPLCACCSQGGGRQIDDQGGSGLSRFLCSEPVVSHAGFRNTSIARESAR